jgi:hypothetical protein
MLIVVAESSRKRSKLSHHPVNAGLVNRIKRFEPVGRAATYWDRGEEADSNV